VNALILAGSRGPDDPLAKAAGVRHKALLPINGQPMLLRVVRALLAHPAIDKVHVSIEDEKALANVPELAALVADGRLNRIATAESPPLWSGRFEELGVISHSWITTGDHLLLTGAMIDAFWLVC
jgi:hypothetical protein